MASLLKPYLQVMFLARAVCSFSSTVALKPIEMRIIVAWQIWKLLW